MHFDPKLRYNWFEFICKSFILEEPYSTHINSILKFQLKKYGF